MNDKDWLFYSMVTECFVAIIGIILAIYYFLIA